jgi:hypothetical protein
LWENFYFLNLGPMLCWLFWAIFGKKIDVFLFKINVMIFFLYTWLQSESKIAIFLNFCFGESVLKVKTAVPVIRIWHWMWMIIFYNFYNFIIYNLSFFIISDFKLKRRSQDVATGVDHSKYKWVLLGLQTRKFYCNFYCKFDCNFDCKFFCKYYCIFYWKTELYILL